MFNYHSMFIHIPRTGGNSISTAMYRYFRPRPTHFHAVPELQHLDWPGHAKLCEVRSVIDNYAGVYKFAFVRNPYAWLRSMYSYKRYVEPETIPDALVRATPTDQAVFTCTLNEWVLRLGADLEPPDSQASYVLYEGVVEADFVGHFETLKEDWDLLCETIGVPRIALPRVNSSPRTGVGDLTDESKERIKELYEMDFDLFYSQTVLAR